MAFQLFPTPPIKPLKLMGAGSADATAAITGIQEPPGIQPGGVIYLRVALSDPGAPPTSSATPTLRLCAGTGEPVELPISTVRVRIYNRPGTDPSDRVARANINPDLPGDDVYQVEITLDKPGNLWTLQIQNNDASPRDVVCVVADNRSQSQQPWLDLPHERNFALPDQKLTEKILIRNRGTGPLEITTKPGPLDNSGFVVIAVPQAPISPNGTDDLTITFDPAAGAGSGTYDLIMACNDDLASIGKPEATHNKQITLSGSVTRVTQICPAGRPPGATFTATITGQNLAHIQTIAFVQDSGIGVQSDTIKLSPNELQCTLVISPEARPGKYALMLNDATVASSAVQFEVTSAPTLLVLPYGGPDLGDFPDVRSNLKLAAFSPNGRQIAAAGQDGYAYLWDAESGALLHRLAHQGAVTSISYNAQGDKVVTASRDHLAYIWDANSGTLLRSLQGHSGDVLTAEFSPDGQQVITAGCDNTARIWSVARGHELQLLQHKGEVVVGSFSGDGTRVVTAGGEQDAHIWSLREGAALHLLHHDSPVAWATWLRGQYEDDIGVLTVTRNATACWWKQVDLTKAPQPLPLPTVNHQVSTAAISPDLDWIATVVKAEAVCLWRTGQLEAAGKLTAGGVGPGVAVAYSSDSRTLATTHANGMVYLWDGEGLDQLMQLEGHQDQVVAALFSPTGDRLITVSRDKTLRVWAVQKFPRIYRIGNSGLQGDPAFQFLIGGRDLAETKAVRFLHNQEFKIKQIAVVDDRSIALHLDLTSAKEGVYTLEIELVMASGAIVASTPQTFTLKRRETMSTVPEFYALGVKELKFRHSQYSQDQMVNPWMGISDKVEPNKLWLIIPGVRLAAPDGDGACRAVIYADQAMISGKLGIGCINDGQYATNERLYVKGPVRIDGPLVVTGQITKMAGGFQIDHPLDPEHKYLSHSFVESPDMKNFYDGVVTLDAHGEAWVELPAWFETLNREFRYQLTALGASAPGLYVAEEMQNNCFKIAGGKSGLKVSWQVTGIRQDTFAQEHPLPVEAEKPA